MPIGTFPLASRAAISSSVCNEVAIRKLPSAALQNPVSSGLPQLNARYCSLLKSNHLKSKNSLPTLEVIAQTHQGLGLNIIFNPSLWCPIKKSYSLVYLPAYNFLQLVPEFTMKNIKRHRSVNSNLACYSGREVSLNQTAYSRLSSSLMMNFLCAKSDAALCECIKFTLLQENEDRSLSWWDGGIFELRSIGNPNKVSYVPTILGNLQLKPHPEQGSVEICSGFHLFGAFHQNISFFLSRKREQRNKLQPCVVGITRILHKSIVDSALSLRRCKGLAIRHSNASY
ncbi:Glucose-1-phosphate adenylyltransferase large subunit 2, chloroplastic/amyloplastic [Senna tora]|uniref:Glucose-1-phosphate adenylyltransferase large subunit 2, chloroplastic/amyloplastic n=1 Tax=Senna tora TaxID=362788 RepID=A0A834TBY3_9FABA|nr:Glucose-1-phosphate adenylyltransferase large subunit 2, chloroplastic/amyloplastic [Senna tora]